VESFVSVQKSFRAVEKCFVYSSGSQLDSLKPFASRMESSCFSEILQHQFLTISYLTFDHRQIGCIHLSNPLDILKALSVFRAPHTHHAVLGNVFQLDTVGVGVWKSLQPDFQEISMG